MIEPTTHTQDPAIPVKAGIPSLQRRVPKLRFPEFDGEWNENKIGRLFHLKAGGDIEKRHVSEKKSEKFKYPIYANAEKDKGFYGYSDIYKANSGTITVAGRGVNIGIAHVRDHKFYPIVRLLVLNPIDDVDVYFGEYAINNLNLFIESTGVPQLTAPQLSNYRITLPSLPEQQKIAGFLTAVDTKVQQLTQKKELLEQYKKGVMQQLFSQRLRFKKEDGSAFPDWEEKRLGDVLKIGSGRDYKHLEEGEYPVYGTGGYMTSVNDFLYDGESVGIGRKGTIDKPVFLSGKFWTVDTLFYTNSFKHVIPKFIYLKFQIINWRKYNEASGVPSLSKSTLEKIKIDVPLIEEQQKIADYLGAIDTKIEQVVQALEATQQFKKGLLQQLFV